MKKSWRPSFAWVFIVFFLAIGATVIALLWMGKTSLTEASGVIITMLGMGGAVTGVYAGGRSFEKTRGSTDNELELD